MVTSEANRRRASAAGERGLYLDLSEVNRLLR